MNRQTSDVIVIGGGIIGCACAWRLGQRGVAVTLLERGQIGRQASWAGAGILHAGSLARRDPLATLRRASVRCYAAFAAELHQRTGIDPEYLPCGALDLITDDNQDAAADREAAAAQANAGPPRAAKLSRAEALELEPALSSRIRGALLLSHVAQVRNPRLLRALRTACEQADVRIREGVEVTDLAVEAAGAAGGRVVGVESDHGRLAAPRVILAAGAWSAQIGGRLRGLIDVRPVRGQIVLYRVEPPLLSRVITHGKSYLVPRRDGHILAGATEEHDAGFDASTTEPGVAKLRRMAGRFVPALAGAEPLSAWAGLRPGSPDGRPYLGPVPGLEGLIAATGHFRSGLVLAPVTADLITQLVTTGRTEADLAPFLPGRG